MLRGLRDAHRFSHEAKRLVETALPGQAPSVHVPGDNGRERGQAEALADQVAAQERYVLLEQFDRRRVLGQVMVRLGHDLVGHDLKRDLAELGGDG